MQKLTIILDAAHGEEVAGKRSPDGKFREYKWSRDIIADITPKLQALGYEVFQTNPTTKEIGLSARANVANLLKKPRKVLISLHVNAAGSGTVWMNARGFSVYTTKGKTNSDVLAEILMRQLKANFPELKARADMSDGDLDIEEDFTVIFKAKCPAILVEWNFQDNKDDVEILMNPEYNSRFVNTLIKAINEANNVLS